MPLLIDMFLQLQCHSRSVSSNRAEAREIRSHWGHVSPSLQVKECEKEQEAIEVANSLRIPSEGARSSKDDGKSLFSANISNTLRLRILDESGRIVGPLRSSDSLCQKVCEGNNMIEQRTYNLLYIYI